MSGAGGTYATPRDGPLSHASMQDASCCRLIFPPRPGVTSAAAHDWLNEQPDA